jgi:hypothetical protein
MPEVTKTVTKTKADGTTVKRETTVKAQDGRAVTISQNAEGKAVIEVAPKEAVAKQPLPDYQTILTLGVIVAVAVWGLVEVIKLFFKGWKKTHDGKTPWFWAGGLRLVALGAGAGAGTALYGSLGGAGAGWPWGSAIGLGAGALCTIIVGVVKSRISKKA